MDICTEHLAVVALRVVVFLVGVALAVVVLRVVVFLVGVTLAVVVFRVVVFLVGVALPPARLSLYLSVLDIPLYCVYSFV